MTLKHDELQLLIHQGEGYNVEFKESFSKNISREICAFANANGGKILLGVNDEGQIKGTTISNNLISQIYDIARNLDPPLKVEVSRLEDVLIINIPEGTDKPYSLNGKFYIRQGTNSQQLKRNEIRRFFQEEGLVLFDEKPNYDYDLEKDFAEATFEAFLEMSRTTPILGRYDILENLELIRNDYLKNAGVLLFCSKVTRFFPSATITCVLFRGRDKYKILDRKEFEQDLYANYQNVFNYLQSKLNTEYIIKGGPREEKLELPESALREAILNAVAHRDYFSNANIQVYVFSDRVEITNPGGLPPGMSYSDLGKKSMPRNFLIFGLMQRMGLVEKVGPGILRLNQAMEEYRLEKPLIEADENWFTIIFKRAELEKVSFEGRETTQKTREKTGEKSREKIIRLIKGTPQITLRELAEETGLSIKGVEWNIKKLKIENILKREGPDKGGYWKVVEDEN